MRTVFSAGNRCCVDVDCACHADDGGGDDADVDDEFAVDVVLCGLGTVEKHPTNRSGCGIWWTHFVMACLVYLAMKG